MFEFQTIHTSSAWRKLPTSLQLESQKGEEKPWEKKGEHKAVTNNSKDWIGPEKYDHLK